MYHEATLWIKAYYDSIEEMPTEAKVYFPDDNEPILMNAEEMIKLSKEGWYTIVHESNFGICDHWTSWKLEDWVYNKFLRIIEYKVNGEKLGYNRVSWTVGLTRDANYWESEVWNS